MRIKVLGLLIIFPFFGCESEDAAPASVNCGVGTRLGGDGNACVPVLGEGVELNTEGVVIATGMITGETDEEAYNRGFAAGESSVTQVQCAAGTELSESGDCQPTDEFRQSAFDEGAASVTPLNCGEGTEPNDAGDACQPTMAYRDSIFAQGAASITVVTCAPGTGLDENGTQCIANLGDLVEVDAETGTIRPTQAALDAARETGRLAGVASVIPLNCAAGTAVNGAGDACVPTAEFRAAAVEEGRLAGVASVTPLNCAAGTAVNGAGDACVPTAEFRAAAVEEGRLVGVASVTPLNCAAGTMANAAGDACIPNLGANAEVAADGTVQATAAALETARVLGMESVDGSTFCGDTTLWDAPADLCESDDCFNAPCQNGGTCIDGNASYTCECPAGYGGANCEVDIDDCAVNPCQNGGACADGVNSFVCTCAAGFDGDTCENNIDDCADSPCLNGGVCTDGIATYSCDCADGFIGDTCQLESGADGFPQSSTGADALFNCVSYNYFRVQEICNTGRFLACDWDNPSRECSMAYREQGVDGRTCISWYRSERPTRENADSIVGELSDFHTASRYFAATQTCYAHTDVTRSSGSGFGYNRTFACDTAFCEASCRGFGYQCTLNTGANVEAIYMGCSGHDGYRCTVNASTSVQTITFFGGEAGSQVLNYQSRETDRSGVRNGVQQNFTGN